MGIILGGVSASDLIMDGQSVSLYVGGNPPVKVWPTTDVVQITLGTLYEARDQFRAALADRGLHYNTVTEIPFDIDLVGTGSTNSMFNDCWALTSVPAMDTSQVTNMAYMFSQCSSLVSVPDMDTAQVAYMDYMLYNCQSLTDGNVRLLGKHPNVSTTGMINNSGLTREPWYNADGTPLAPRTVTIDGSATGWKQATATGDTGLIQEWIGGNRVRFHAPIKCNQRVYNTTSGLDLIDAGSMIPAGAPVAPFTYNGPYIFTEVL